MEYPTQAPSSLLVLPKTGERDWESLKFTVQEHRLRANHRAIEHVPSPSQPHIHLTTRLLLFSLSVMSDSLPPHELQHARLPHLSLFPWVCSDSYLLSQWSHATIASSIAPFSSCPQSFPASGSFPMSQFFALGGQSIGASAPVLPMNIQGWFHSGLTGLISLLSKGLSRISSNTTVWKHQFSSAQPSLWSNYHIRTWVLEKPQLRLYRPLSAKWCLCFLICCQGVSWLFFQETRVF